MRRVAIRTLLLVTAVGSLAGCGGAASTEGEAAKTPPDTALKVNPTSSADCIAEVEQRRRVAADKWHVNPASEPRARGPYGREVAALRKVLAACERKWPDDEALAEAALTMDSTLGDSGAVTKKLKQQEAAVPEGKDANFYYLLGLSASNSRDYPTAVGAYKKFLALADPSDPRVATVRSSITVLRQQADAS